MLISVLLFKYNFGLYLKNKQIKTKLILVVLGLILSSQNIMVQVPSYNDLGSKEKQQEDNEKDIVKKSEDKSILPN